MCKVRSVYPARDDIDRGSGRVRGVVAWESEALSQREVYK